MPITLPTAAEYERMLTAAAKRAAVLRLLRETEAERTAHRRAIAAVLAVKETAAVKAAAQRILDQLPDEDPEQVAARRQVLA